ncbi:MAG: thioredoxin family protein [Pseudomonadota bacterium]
MKKASSRVRERRKKPASNTEKSQLKPANPSRRDFMGNAATYGLGAAALGGIGYWAVDSVIAGIAEGDISRIGNGVPSVVQIHDPQCSVCARLMRQTRNALDNFDDGELQFLVANIKSGEGRELAAKYGVPHVTLLLFNKVGRHVHTISGVQSSDVLTPLFRSLSGGTLAQSG